MYWDRPDCELVSVKCASMVLNVRLQAVVQLGLPRYLIEKRAVYRKGDIQALLLADQVQPNKLLRDLQEQHREAQIKQKAHPSRRYKTRPDLLPAEAKAAKEATKTNRKPPPKEKRPRDPWAYFKRLRDLTGT